MKQTLVTILTTLIAIAIVSIIYVRQTQDNTFNSGYVVGVNDGMRSTLSVIEEMKSNTITNKLSGQDFAKRVADKVNALKNQR